MMVGWAWQFLRPAVLGIWNLEFGIWNLELGTRRTDAPFQMVRLLT